MVKAYCVFGTVDFRAVGPDAPDMGDFALADADGKIGIVGIGFCRGLWTALAALLFLLADFPEPCRPDDLAAKTHPAIGAWHGIALIGGKKPGFFKPAAANDLLAAEQFLVDGIPGKRTGGSANHGTERPADGTANGGSGNLQDNSGHYQ